jgi:hypothetical protein
MATITSPPTVGNRASGRGYLWGGIGLGVLAIVLGIAHYAFKLIDLAPWQVPIVTTLGALLLLVSLSQRRTVTRFLVLVLILALAGFEWFFLLSLSKLPEYEGPGQSGLMMPTFQTARADGRPFSDQDLKDGSPHILTFFRGRW